MANSEHPRHGCLRWQISIMLDSSKSTCCDVIYNPLLIPNHYHRDKCSCDYRENKTQECELFSHEQPYLP